MFRSFHGVPRRARSAIVSAALLIPSVVFVPSDAWGGLTAFGDGQVSVPSNVPTGTIVARTYYTPQQFCDKASCEITGVRLSEKGSLWSSVDGPDIETMVSGLSTRMLFDGVPATKNTRTTIRNTVEVQLFRDSRPPQSGSLKPGFFNAHYYVDYKSGLLGGTTLIYLAASIRFINGTCSVPDQTVTLPKVGQNDFKGVGSTAGSIGFQLRLNNCPAGYNRIGYQFSPIDGAAASMPGTLNLRPDSTATGLGIRITDGGGQPLPFQQSQTVTGYDKNTGGSPTVSLNAAYVQTGATVGSGSVRAGAQILLDYQ